jgi:uncharacterized oxidoreductase
MPDLNFAKIGLIFATGQSIVLVIFTLTIKRDRIMKLANNKILITGGATGIGLGLVERFFQEGNAIIICGRRASVLQEVRDKYPAVITRVCDLANEADRASLYHWVAEKHADLNVLVNNAGMQNWMNISDEDFFSKAKIEIAINIEAPLHLTALFLKLPKLDTIINVTSGLSFVPFAKVPVYSATKAFFHSFSLSAQYQLKSRNIEVIEMIPPALNTDLGGKGLHEGQPPVTDFVAAVFQQMKEGKTALSFGFSEQMVKATPEGIQAAFNRLNP